MASLPNATRAIVSRSKVLGYLLSLVHPDGVTKARFFITYGFSRHDWELLASAMVQHAGAHPVTQTVESEFGVRYVVDGALETPVGRAPLVRAVWFIATGRDVPELVTAYPIRPRSST